LKKNNCYKIICIIILAIALFCSNISVQSKTSIYPEIKNHQIGDKGVCLSSELPVSNISHEIILEEDFSKGVIPPIDPILGQWVHKITAKNATWYIDESIPYTDPYCATISRWDYEGLQNEWLITPRLDFSNYDVVNLRFFWYTSHLTAVWNDVIDLIVSISLDEGKTWTILWNEDDFDPFISWTWQDSGEIDLSAYAHKSNVQIGFWYYSNNITDPDAQEFSIDNIEIYGNSDQFICDTGGPYEIAWSWNIKYGVQFHGNVIGGQMPYSDWTWYFGDGNTSKVRYSPNHKYNNVGTYNVTLIVTDSSKPSHIAFANTTVKVIETSPSVIEIEIQPSIGLLAEVKNTGNLNVSYLNWTMVIEWGPLTLFKREVGNGTIQFIGAKSITSLRSSYNIIWLGFLRVTIEVKPLNTYREEKIQMVLIVGTFIFPIISR